MAVLTASTHPRAARCWTGLPAFLAALVLLAAAPRAVAQPTAEYQIKAVFLYHFAQFTEWPPEAFTSPRDSIVIGVLGDDPFGAYLNETVRNERVNRRPLAVRRYKRVEDVEACHILFISPSERGRLSQHLTALRGRSLLTVGDTDRFAQAGGMVQFFTDQNKIRLRINVEAVRSEQLRISSKLLRLAEIERG